MAADDTALPADADAPQPIPGAAKAPAPGSPDSPDSPGPSAAPGASANGSHDPALLDRWVDRVAALLELPVHEVDVSLVLDLARDAAHGIARPAAPLTTFLLGLAVGRAGGGADDARRLAADITAEIAHLRDPVGPLDADGRSGGGADLLRADGRRPPADSDLGGRA